MMTYTETKLNDGHTTFSPAALQNETKATISKRANQTTTYLQKNHGTEKINEEIQNWD